MSDPVKLLFDECVGKPLVEQLAAAVAFGTREVVIRHVIDHIGGGKHDEVWVPQVAEEGWIVVTGDSGKGGRKKGEKLPIVCRQYRVTHVMFSPKIHAKTSFEKLRAILGVWPQLIGLADQPRGSAWLIRLTQSGVARLVAKDD